MSCSATKFEKIVEFWENQSKSVSAKSEQYKRYDYLDDSDVAETQSLSTVETKKKKVGFKLHRKPKSESRHELSFKTKERGKSKRKKKPKRDVETGTESSSSPRSSVSYCHTDEEPFLPPPLNRCYGCSNVDDKRLIPRRSIESFNNGQTGYEHGAYAGALGCPSLSSGRS